MAVMKHYVLREAVSATEGPLRPGVMEVTEQSDDQRAGNAVEYDWRRANLSIPRQNRADSTAPTSGRQLTREPTEAAQQEIQLPELRQPGRQRGRPRKSNLPEPIQEEEDPVEQPRQHADGTGSRPRRDRRCPQRFLLLVPFFLLTMAGSGKADESTEDIVSRNGVFFKREGTVSFTDSHWMVSTEISLKRIDEFFSFAEERLLPLTKPGKEKWTSNFAVAIRKRVTGKATTYATKWQETKRRFEGLRMSVLGLHGKRQRRGLVDAGGVALNWLFGIAKQKDLDILDRKMARLGTVTEQVVHLVKEHASLVNETLWETHLTAEILANLTKAHEQLEFVTSRLLQNMSAADIEVDEKLPALARAEDIMEAWLVTLQAADKAVDNLAAGLATLAQGRLSPWLFSPQNLINVMEHVRKVMPEG